MAERQHNKRPAHRSSAEKKNLFFCTSLQTGLIETALFFISFLLTKQYLSPQQVLTIVFFFHNFQRFHSYFFLIMFPSLKGCLQGNKQTNKK